MVLFNRYMRKDTHPASVSQDSYDGEATGAWHLEEGGMPLAKLHRKWSWLITMAKFGFPVGMEIAARLMGEGVFISWRMAEKSFPYLTSFPQFHFLAFIWMLVPVKSMHSHNLLGQELIQFIINLSKCQWVSSLIQLIRQPLKRRISIRKVAGMRPPPFGSSHHLCQGRVITGV